MDNGFLLSPEKKKEAVKGLFSYLGLFAAAVTVLVFSALFFADVSFSFAGTLSLSLSFFLLFVSSYMMYVSLFETGRAYGAREEAVTTLDARRAALFERTRTEGSYTALAAFCRAVGERETKAQRERVLECHFVTEEEVAAARARPKRERTKKERRLLRALDRLHAVTLSPHALLADRPEVGRRAPLSVSTGAMRARRTLGFLLPLALFTAVSVSVVCRVMTDPSPDLIVGYLLKLFTLLQSGVKGFRAGFYHVTCDKCDVMREQCELLEEYFKGIGEKEASTPRAQEVE